MIVQVFQFQYLYMIINLPIVLSIHVVVDLNLRVRVDISFVFVRHENTQNFMNLLKLTGSRKIISESSLLFRSSLSMFELNFMNSKDTDQQQCQNKEISHLIIIIQLTQPAFIVDTILNSHYIN